MDCSEDDEQVRIIENEMEEAVKLEDEQQKIDWKSIFNDKTEVKNTRRLVLCFLIQFFQQFTGINVIAFYGTNSPWTDADVRFR